MLRSLNKGGKPKDKKEMSKDELDYVERSDREARKHRIKVALRKKQIEEAEKALGGV
jgi:hypothetical protein